MTAAYTLDQLPFVFTMISTAYNYTPTKQCELSVYYSQNMTHTYNKIVICNVITALTIIIPTLDRLWQSTYFSKCHQIQWGCGTTDGWKIAPYVHLPLGGKPQASYKPKLPTKKSDILNKRKTQISIGIWTLKIWFPRMLLHYISHFCLHRRM